ncbi:hypothetical protein [Xanthomonas prunicola]|uniref:hypothetical protein n=1 Tax=Xanthomonas TaxID=338 RepID=UPI0021B3C1AC|nr:hypothetical protein [Xanthomonas prunicola]UXA53369.1 hypothetical protein M0D45_00750 [Xanthomonas prunicola]
MSLTKKIEIRCSACKSWFPSPIFFGDADTFDAAMMSGNIVNCPHCGQITHCNKENMRANFGDGGFSGNDTTG